MSTKILKISILSFFIIFSLHCMEESFGNWEKAKSVGPLTYLKFEEVKESDGKHFGWLYVEEFNDYIYAAITIHDSGYYVDYVDPEFNVSISDGFYFWKSLDLIKNDPKAKFSYSVKKVEWYDKPIMVPNIERDETAPFDSEQNKAYDEALLNMNNLQRSHRYNYLAFANCCSRVYLYKEIAPIELSPNAKDLIASSNMYKDFSEETKQDILKLIPNYAYRILYSWLEDKLQNSGLSAVPWTEVSSKEYVFNKERVIDQFIIEDLVKFILRKGSDINIYKILEDIESLNPCTVEERKIMEEALLERFKSWGHPRVLGMTAIGNINCNYGLLQWD